VGEAVLRRIAKSRKGTDIKAALIDATLREDPNVGVNYYKLEFGVEGSTFRRHNVAVCCARDGKLFTLNAQAPELAWVQVRKDFFKIADSFNLVST
jgi:PsbP